MELDRTTIVAVTIGVGATVAGILGPLSGEDLRLIYIAILTFAAGRIYENNRLKRLKPT